MAQPDVIARALARTRSSSAGDSVTSDEIREFLQKRVAGFALLGAVLFGLFFVWRSVTVAVETWMLGKPSDWGSVLGISSQGMLFAVIWLICRGKRRSLRFPGLATHLYHFERHEAGESRNERLLTETLQTGRVRSVRRVRDEVEREIVTDFLMGSNFFRVADPAGEPIVYFGRPTVCPNPFARL